MDALGVWQKSTNPENGTPKKKKVYYRFLILDRQTFENRREAVLGSMTFETRREAILGSQTFEFPCSKKMDF